MKNIFVGVTWFKLTALASLEGRRIGATKNVTPTQEVVLKNRVA